MSRLPSALHAGPRLDHPWARDGHAFVAPPVEAGIRPGRVADEPRAGPSPERVGPVRPPDQGVLGRPPRLTPAGPRPAPRSGLELGGERGAVSVARGPRCHSGRPHRGAQAARPRRVLRGRPRPHHGLGPPISAARRGGRRPPPGPRAPRVPRQHRPREGRRPGAARAGGEPRLAGPAGPVAVGRGAQAPVEPPDGPAPLGWRHGPQARPGRPGGVSARRARLGARLASAPQAFLGGRGPAAGQWASLTVFSPRQSPFVRAAAGPPAGRPVRAMAQHPRAGAPGGWRAHPSCLSLCARAVRRGATASGVQASSTRVLVDGSATPRPPPRRRARRLRPPAGVELLAGRAVRAPTAHHGEPWLGGRVQDGLAAALHVLPPRRAASRWGPNVAHGRSRRRRGVPLPRCEAQPRGHRGLPPVARPAHPRSSAPWGPMFIVLIPPVVAQKLGLKKFDHRRTRIEPILPSAPRLQRGPGHIKPLSGLPLRQSLDLQAAVLLKEFSASEASRALVTIHIAPLFAIDDSTHRSLLPKPWP
jgi:hypothetical protein